MEIGSIKLAVIGIPNQVPEPRISRIEPITRSAKVKPIPIPTPSKADLTTVFLLANISARPRMIQFTTISGKNKPSAS